MKTKYDIANTAEDISEALSQVEKEFDFPSDFYQSFFAGKREIYQTEFSQVKQFDEKWIRAIEAYYPSLVTITKRLKSSLKNVEEILPIEKTKKVGPRAIRHLSSHSELIVDVDENDEVIPGRLLSEQSEIEYGIYENRFVMTLIKRLNSFINERLKIIEAEMKGVRDTHLRYETAFEFIEADYEMSIDVRQIETVNKRKANEHNIDVFERAQRLQKLVSRLNNCQFMRIMKKYRTVSSPIMKTQIILKNPDFRNAYLLWLYLDKYYTLDYELDTKTTNKRFKADYSKALDQNFMTLFTAFFNNDHRELDGPSDERSKFRSKKAVHKNKLVDEFVVDPTSMEIEKYIANEYFLNKQEELFKPAYTKAIASEKTYTMGLKNLLTQNLKITNDLYAKFFDIDQDKDVFDLLIHGENPIEEIDQAIEKHKIARSIREVKQKDYMESIKLEKKWLRITRQKQREMLSYEKKNLSKRVKDRIAEIEKGYDLVKESNEREFLKRKEILVRQSRDDVNYLSKKLKKQREFEKEKLSKKEKELFADKKKKTIKIKEQKLAKQAEKNTKQIERLEKKLLDRKTKLKEKHKEAIRKEREKYANSNKKGIEKINQKMINDLKREKDQHIKKVENLKERIEEIDKKISE